MNFMYITSLEVYIIITVSILSNDISIYLIVIYVNNKIEKGIKVE